MVSQGKSFLTIFIWRKEVSGMKKALDRSAIEKEAMFWADIKKKLSETPVRICRK